MNSMLPHGRKAPRLIAMSVLLLLSMLTAGCGRNATKAIKAEAQADNFLAGGDLVRAAEMLDEAVSYDGNDPARWVKLGRARRDLKQPQQAAEAFQQAFDLDPANIEAMQNLAVLYIAGRQFESAKRVVDPLLSLSPDDIAGILATGAIAYYEERYPDAVRLADQLIQLAPDQKEGYVLKAHVLEKTGRAAEGARLLESRLRSAPDDADMAEQLLGLYRSMGDLQGVRSTALRLATLKPDDPRYQLESVRAYHAQGAVADRERITTNILSRYRANPSILGALADFWIAALPREEAARRIADVGGRSAPAVKAALAARLVRIDALPAANTLLNFVADQPVTSANVDLHAMFAALLMARGKTQAARDQAEAVLAFDAGNDVALLTRARAHLAAKDYDKALTDAQSIVANDMNEGASLLIARIYAEKGNDVLAAAAFADAQSGSPRSLAVASARADWLIRKGRAAEAAQVAGLFARQVNNSGAWSFYEQTCKAAADPICLAQAKARGRS